MKKVYVDGMICGVESAKNLAIRRGRGAKEIAVIGYNGSALFKKVRNTYRFAGIPLVSQKEK